MRDDEERIYGPHQHGKIWRIHIVTRRLRGGRKTIYKKFAKREDAERWLAGARDEAQGITLKMGAAQFIAKQRANGNAESTLGLYVYRLRAILDLPANDQRSLSWLRQRGAELYAASKLKKNGAPRAPDTHIGGLRIGKQFGDWCVEHKHLRANPFAGVKPEGKLRRGSTKSRLRVDEGRAVREACHAEGGIDGALTLAYLLLGGRASEIVDRVGRDLDDDDRLLCVDRTKTEAGERKLEIPEELQPLLVALKRGPYERLFVNLSGQPMSRRVAYQRVTAFIERVIGREKIGPQVLRRSQGTFAIDAGATGHAVSAHLGHRSAVGLSAVTTRSYVGGNAVRDAKNQRAFKVLAGGKP